MSTNAAADAIPKREPPTLSCWTASSTECLLSSPVSGGGSRDENGDQQSFVLLNNVMESNTDTSNGKGDDKATGFCDQLTLELDGFLKKLSPARTQGDHRADEILNLLQSMGTRFPDPQKQSDGSSSDDNKNGDKIRGDNSIFISREYRHQDFFAKKHPRLHELISTISNTLDREFGAMQDNHSSNNGYPESACTRTSIRLDFSMTSVQLALYPGDSKSGYRKHCDRQHSCREEGTKSYGSASNLSASKQSNTKPERLITCIYYLTDDDWDASLDGGALRLFHPGDDGDGDDPDTSSEFGENNQSSSSSFYTDVVPFRDRMVVFRSDRVQHQVLPSHRRPRLAITTWFYGIISKIPEDNAVTGISASTSSSSQTANRTRSVASNDSRSILPLPIHPVSSLEEQPSTATRRKSATSNANGTKDQPPTIFVSLASYRDSETRPTIDAMYSTALNPRRIFTGIVAQLEEGEKDDEDIWTSITGTHERGEASKTWTPGSHQLRAMRLHARDATGPCYARGLCQSLYRGEDYVLQIDSHMRFRPNWDEYLIQTIEGLQDRRKRQTSTGDKLDDCDKILLTAYPVGYTLPNNIPNETRGTYLVPWKFDAQGMLRQRGRLVRRRFADGNDSSTDKPSAKVAFPSSVTHAHRQYLYAGGFNFGPARIVRDVPYDTMGLHHLFFGEELSMAVRLFTHGYDLYAPEETVCYHLWSRSHRPTNPSTAPATATTKSTKPSATVAREKRLRKLSRAMVKRQLLGDEAMVGAHCGLGSSRTAAAFANRLGVDFERRAFVREGWDCGELSSEDFVGNNGDGNESLFPADSVEAKVASLDSNAQALIGMFLQGLQN